MDMIALNLADVSFSYGDRAVLEDFNLRVSPGEFACLLGPSGCGKSTVLRLMAGLLSPVGGRLERSVGSVSFVFQDARLLPWKTARENVLLPFAVEGGVAPGAEECLRWVGLEKVGELFPHQLSGGMKQRVAIARALIRRPQLLLMDEPFSALDEGTREDLEKLLRELWGKLGFTLVFVTHSLSEAVYLGERVLVMGAQGKLLRDERVKLSERGADVRTSPEFNGQLRELSSWMRQAREQLR
jgi:NitT/TauT family transport system ATP-binding protein